MYDVESTTPGLYIAWKLIVILNGAMPDCGPQPHQTSATLWWSVIAVKPSRKRGRNNGAAAGLLTKICKNVHQNVIF